MLIELYDQNRGSSLARVSLKEISKMGFHGEIAHIVQDLDYFEVFNDGDLLVDVLVRVCRADTEELEDLLNMLKRMCCNTEYMFVYTLELLATVDGLLGQELVDENLHHRNTTSSGTFGGDMGEEGDGDDVDSRHSVLLIRRRKLQRLRQELEHAAVWQKREVISTTTTPTHTPTPRTLTLLSLALAISLYCPYSTHFTHSTTPAPLTLPSLLLSLNSLIALTHCICTTLTDCISFHD